MCTTAVVLFLWVAGLIIAILAKNNQIESLEKRIKGLEKKLGYQ